MSDEIAVGSLWRSRDERKPDLVVQIMSLGLGRVLHRNVRTRRYASSDPAKFLSRNTRGGYRKLEPGEKF